MGKNAPRVVSAILVLLAAGCATDMELLTPDGRPLASEPPAPYRIALLPLANAEALVQEHEGLRFQIAPDALCSRLAARMTDLRAATEVFTVATVEAAAARNADLLLVPRVASAPELTHAGFSEQWWASGLLWITTWIGGLLVPDSTYHAVITLDCDLRNARDPDEAMGFTAASGETDLNFWDRNTVVSGGFFLSLVLPPFFTSDNAKTTSDTLSQRALDKVAGRITSFVKFELSDRERDGCGQVDLETPENGAVVGATTRVAGVVNGRHGIAEVAVQANGVPVALSTPIRDAIDQQIGTRFRQPFATQEIALQEGANTITLVITLLDTQRETPRRLVSARTLVVHRPVVAATTAGRGQP